ncbi:unnamed protein product [Dracunculus medinensis]|uniref:Zinc finger protein 830 n=1 Tax=Dracunculus medinensis TaxID=318479 RepID=A0A0N4UCG5_DRAME|nr:unnamed protein product [Dracunculus medinensis]
MQLSSEITLERLEEEPQATAGSRLLQQRQIDVDLNSEQVEMSAALPNPAIAKDLKDGNLLCLVKSKLWIAHSNGRKHRENIAILKKNFIATTNNNQQQNDDKRNNKKRNLNDQNALSVSSPKKFKSNNDDIKSTVDPVPVSSLQKREEPKIETKKIGKKIIDGVPEGFFDDEKLNSRVVETIEKKANMEDEYANFMKELHEAKQKHDEKEIMEEEISGIKRDIEHIDEQIECWRRVNKYEVKLEELRKKFRQQRANSPSISANTMECDVPTLEDDDSNIDEFMDWRRKHL